MLFLSAESFFPSGIVKILIRISSWRTILSIPKQNWLLNKWNLLMDIVYPHQSYLTCLTGFIFLGKNQSNFSQTECSRSSIYHQRLLDYLILFPPQNLFPEISSSEINILSRFARVSQSSNEAETSFLSRFKTPSDVSSTPSESITECYGSLVELFVSHITKFWRFIPNICFIPLQNLPVKKGTILIPFNKARSYRESPVFWSNNWSTFPACIWHGRGLQSK